MIPVPLNDTQHYIFCLATDAYFFSLREREREREGGGERERGGGGVVGGRGREG